MIKLEAQRQLQWQWWWWWRWWLQRHRQRRLGWQWKRWQRQREQLLMKNLKNNSKRIEPNRTEPICLMQKSSRQNKNTEKTPYQSRERESGIYVDASIFRYLGNALAEIMWSHPISCWMLKIGQRRRYRFSVYILVIIPWIADEKHFIKLTKCVWAKNLCYYELPPPPPLSFSHSIALCISVTLSQFMRTFEERR